MAGIKSPEPIETHQGRAAQAYLCSWGTEEAPAFSISLVPTGRSGRTFNGISFSELRLHARDHFQAPEILAELEVLLSKATKQLPLPLDLPDLVAPPRPALRTRPRQQRPGS